MNHIEQCRTDVDDLAKNAMVAGGLALAALFVFVVGTSIVNIFRALGGI